MDKIILLVYRVYQKKSGKPWIYWGCTGFDSRLVHSKNLDFTRVFGSRKTKGIPKGILDTGKEKLLNGVKNIYYRKIVKKGILDTGKIRGKKVENVKCKWIASVAVLFLCQNLGIERDDSMFSDEILEKIFSSEEIKDVPIVYQSILIDVIEKVLKEIDDFQF